MISIMALSTNRVKALSLFSGFILRKRNLSWKRFVLAVFAGRFLRFLGEGYLGARFGDQAAEILASYYPTILVSLLVGAALILVARHVMSRRQADAA